MAEIEDKELRERTRALLEEVHPDDEAVDRVAFRGAQFDHGLAMVHFPAGRGGLGLQPKQQLVINDELRLRTKSCPTLFAYESRLTFQHQLLQQLAHLELAHRVQLRTEFHDHVLNALLAPF